MSNRSWFYAADGQQQGPFPEAQLRDLITRGTVRADTLVWTEGMSGWQRAAEIPGLVPGGSGPPVIPQAGGPVMATGGYSGGTLSIDFGILEFTWRSIVLLIGLILIIPAPWAMVWYLRWIVPCVRVPGRPNLGFTGPAMALVPWYFGALVLMIAVALIGNQWLNDLMFLVQVALYWLFLKWIVANIASNGQPLGLTFSGSPSRARSGLTLDGAFCSGSLSSPSSVGPGSTLPGRGGFAEIFRARDVKSSSMVPDWRYFGVASLPLSPAASSSRYRGCIAGCHAGWRRKRRWPSAAAPEDHLRSRIEPSCATDATSVPSGLKIRPRVSPRPPCALGESCA
jgi:hypothetical protein